MENFKHARSMLRYWLNSIIDSGSDRFTTKDNAKEEQDDNIQTGRLSKETTDAIYYQYKKALESKKNKDKFAQKVEKGITAPVCVALWTMTPKVSHGAAVNDSPPVVVIGVNALLDTQSGELSPEEHSKPWVSREALMPIENEALAIGELSSSDAFLAKTAQESLESWQDVVRYFDRLFMEITSQKAGDFESNEIVHSSVGYVSLRGNSSGSPTFHIEGLYRELLREDIIKNSNDTGALFNNLANAIYSLPKMSTPKSALASLLNPLHSGQMSKDYPAADSQRVAVCSTLESKYGDIVPVSGPPGTGKTTLLQSVVASMWVNAAIDGKQRPPLIVATSKNNQAVTNIIESFRKAVPETERWIPISTLGLYLCSPNKAVSVDNNILYGTVGKSSAIEGSVTELLTTGFIKKATLSYLKSAGVDTLKRAQINALTKIKAHIKASNNIEKAALILDKTYPLETTYLKEVNVNQRTMQKEIDALTLQADQFSLAQTKIINAHHNKPLLLNLFKWLPGGRRKLAATIMGNAEVEKLIGLELINLLIETEEKGGLLAGVKTLLKPQIDNMKHKAANLITNRDILKEFKEHCVKPAFNDFNFNEDETLLVNLKQLLDIHCRYPAFIGALHYWEATWLMKGSIKIKDRKSEIDYWHNLAMLLPCNVSTLSMLPKFFKHTQGKYPPYRMNEEIDLLIMDESGQATPEEGAAAFALAKKALIVGDTKQIQPIWGVSTSVDIGNVSAYLNVDMSETTLDALAQRGAMASNGNVMSMALSASRIGSDQQRGIMLTEHYRCPPTIINYCNELAYENMLIPKTSELDEAILPMMGYAHISSPSEKLDSGIRNPGHAKVLVSWLINRKQEIQAHYCKSNQSIEDVVAIVTPFKGQAKYIKDLLAKKGFDTETMVVGTVHSLQGAEKPVILFMPTYGNNNQGMSFINGSINMLNVAVSRAQQSFIVFGDMNLFDENRSYEPSGLLASHLLADKNNEITDLPLHESLDLAEIGEGAIKHIDTHDSHLEYIYKALDEAKDRVVIVSPFITERALGSDDNALQVKMEKAIARGVLIEVFVDEEKRVSSQTEQYFNQALELLEGTGAKLYGLTKIHHKTLVVDNDMLVEGSFNWLSASRTSRYRQVDKSFAIIRQNAPNEWLTQRIKKSVTDLHENKIIREDGRWIA